MNIKKEKFVQAKTEGEKVKLVHELKLANIQSSVNSQSETLNPIVGSYGMRRNITKIRVQ